MSVRRVKDSGNGPKCQTMLLRGLRFQRLQGGHSDQSPASLPAARIVSMAERVIKRER